MANLDSKHVFMVTAAAVGAFDTGDRLAAARLLEGLAADIRFEVRADAMVGTAAMDARQRLIRYCRNCGRGVVVLDPVEHRAFRTDRKFCSNACRQASYRKRQPVKPSKTPAVIYLGPTAS